ncbi:Mrp/NBP35 family ATP-binding protein, partial [bacterium]|nr:Mrp/NBP35 family ATP-binding protein [bacterium]
MWYYRFAAAPGTAPGCVCLCVERILPVERYGVKVISMGFFLAEEQAVVWRGPMLVKMIDEFLGNVEWGEL